MARATVHVESVRSTLVVDKKKRVRCRAQRRPGTVTTLTREVKDWLRTSMSGHWYLFEEPETHRLMIAFHNHRDAMLFKLTWH